MPVGYPTNAFFYKGEWYNTDGEGAPVTAITDPLTGRIQKYAAGQVVEDYIAPSLIDKRAAGGGFGTMLLDWTAGSEEKAGTGTGLLTDLTEMCPDPDSRSRVVKLVGTGTFSEMYGRTGISLNISDATHLGVWVRATPRVGGEHYAPFKIMMASTAWSAYGYCNLSVRADGRWHYIVTPLSSFVAIGGWSKSAPIVALRVREADGTIGRANLTTAESIIVGPIRKNPKGKAAAIVRFDDGLGSLARNECTVSAPFAGASGVTVAAGTYSFASLVQQFGFRATAYVLTDWIGETGFCTESELRTLQDSYGWNIAFQSAVNPIGYSNAGVRLLGPVGYNLVPVGGVASVDTTANTITTTAANLVIAVGAVGSWVQPFPVEFIGTDLPAPLVTGQRYYLRNDNGGTNTRFTIHPTAYDSVANTNAIDLTTAGTAANFGVRYWGAANDYSAILAEFVGGQVALRNAGFNAWQHYALNQGAWDKYSEQAAIEAGFLTAMTIDLGGVYDGCLPAFSSGVTVTVSGTGSAGALHADWLNICSAIQTDGAKTATDARNYVDALVSAGAVGGNYHHGPTTANVLVLLAYLDQLKLRADQGLIDVLTITELYERIAVERY